MTARALYWPQGTCPKPWVAEVNGERLFDRRGALKRYASEAAALKAAQLSEKEDTPR